MSDTNNIGGQSNDPNIKKHHHHHHHHKPINATNTADGSEQTNDSASADAALKDMLGN